jgi:hypothetical protein
MSVSRRSFLGAAPLAFGPALLTRHASATSAVFAPPSPASSFPTQPAELAREMVGVAHRDPVRVKELLGRNATLARACWDWGFGDWEDALGAASHVGNHEIADLLLKSGARPTIFSAAMLGQLDVVKAFIVASPGIEATPGPHGITLLTHALHGGPGSTPVADYLKTRPGANAQPDSQPLTPEQMAKLTGDYTYGAAADESITISIVNGALLFTRKGATGRNLTHVGDLAFFPAGAPLVRIRFSESGKGLRLSIHDPDLVLEATRT